MTRKLTLFLVCAFEVALILFVAAWSAWGAERVRCEWNTQTALLVTNGETKPAAEIKSLWTTYEFTDDNKVIVLDADGDPSDLQEEKDLHRSITSVSDNNTMIGTGTYSFEGLRMAVSIIIGREKALGVVSGMAADTTVYGGGEAVCASVR